MLIRSNTTQSTTASNQREMLLLLKEARNLRNVLNTETLLQELATLELPVTAPSNTPLLLLNKNISDTSHFETRTGNQNQASNFSNLPHSTEIEQNKIEVLLNALAQTHIQSKIMGSSPAQFQAEMTLANPDNSLLQNLSSTLLSSSHSLESILSILQKVSPQLFQKDSTLLLLKINQQHPELLLSSIDFLQKLPEQNKSVFYPKALQVLKNIYEQLQNELQGKSKPEALGLQQEFIQNLRQIKNLIQIFLKSTPPTILKTSEDSTEQLLNFILNSASSQNKASTEELFSLSVFLKAGFKIEEFILAANHENPLKLALLIIEAQKEDHPEASAKLFQHLVSELKSTLLEKDLFLDKVENFVQKLKPNFPELSSGSLNNSDNNDTTVSNNRFLKEGFIESTPLQNEKIPLQALSLEEGYLPPTQWNLQPSINQIALQSAFLMLRQLPPGLNSLKFEVKGKRNTSKASFSIFTLISSSLGVSEENELEQEEQNAIQNSHLFDRYRVENHNSNVQCLLLGSLAFTLDAPVFLTSGFSGKKIAAPEHFEFYFLLDWIHPEKRYSREDFLTLAESEESKELRQSIQKLNQEGCSAFDQYQNALKKFLNKIQICIPESKASLKEAEKFLTLEVKKHFNIQNQEPERNQLLEAMPRGNLMASILRKTGTLCEKSQNYGEALIHFAEASKGFQGEDHVVVKLENLLQQLRKKFISTQNYAAENWVKKAGLAQHFLKSYQVK